MSRALILGAGILGLWTAHILSENGHDVEVLSANAPVVSTSALAACVLVPFLPGEPDTLSFQRSVRWADETISYMKSLEGGRAFLEGIDCYEFGRKGVVEYGFSIDSLPSLDFSDFELIELGSVIANCDMAVKFKCSLCQAAPFIDWLVDSLRRYGVAFRLGTISSPHEIAWSQYHTVFNCLGYQTVFADPDLTPVSGQSMFIPSSSPTLKGFGIGAGEHAVFSYQQGFHIGAHFLRDVAHVTPQRDLYLSSIDFVEDAFPTLCESVGLAAPVINLDAMERVSSGVRPLRSTGPRVERDENFPNLVHNYGHGAHGWTTGYGSSVAAVALAGLL
jgi:D-amino-acid oxidase